MKKCVYVFDIDGTIANPEHREHLLEKRCDSCLFFPVAPAHNSSCPNCGGTSITRTQESKDRFMDPTLMIKDPPIEKAVALIKRVRELGAEIAFITGRNETSNSEVTKQWLTDNVGWIPDAEPLIMRNPDEDRLPASTYKLLAFYRLRDMYPPESFFFFFEDDPHVFNVYSKFGLVFKSPECWGSIMPTGALGLEDVW